MGGNSTITISLIFAIIGGISAVVGIMSNRDAKKSKEGKLEGIVETQLNNLYALVKEQRDSSDKALTDVKDALRSTQDDVKEIDKRLVSIETSHKANHRPRTVSQ